MAIRPAKPADIPAMMALEQASAAAAHWTRPQYEALFLAEAEKTIRLAWVLDGEKGLAGFLVVHAQLPEWEIENIVVSPSDRQQGLGTRLLASLFEHARKAGCQAIFLEVRESNFPARSLYRKAGFEETGRRPRYYANPSEDGILYRWAPGRELFSL